MKQRAEAHSNILRFDGPRLDAHLSNLIRTASFAKDGYRSYNIVLGYHRDQWCMQPCLWCGKNPVASAYLDDGNETLCEIVINENNQACAELTRPHVCTESEPEA
jgi:hypothetical protein